MDDVVELCGVCAAGDEPTGVLLESVLSFMLARTTHAALPQMSALEKGTLALQLIFAGGLQHDACRRFLFCELSPPYSTAALLRQSRELYLGPAERMVMPDDNEDVRGSVRRNKYVLPLLSRLHHGGTTGEELQPPVDFRGKDVEHLLSVVVRSWCTTGLKPLSPSLSLGELPPGLATYILLHHPARTLQLLQTTVVKPTVPPTWRTLWRKIFFSATDSADEIGGSVHTLLSQGGCADFWPLMMCALVCPLTGTVAGDDGAEGEQPAVFDGPSVFGTHVMLYLWLSEIKKEADKMAVKSFLSAAGSVGEADSTDRSGAEAAPTASDFSCCRALAYGLHLVEKDVAYCSLEDMQCEQAGVVQAAYGLLLSLYHGHSMASLYVRSALDHPEMALFVPSFADLGEKNEGSQCGADGECCSSPMFITALALRLPVAQLYIAERVWRLLESMVVPGGEETREMQRTELDARLKVLLNSHIFCDLPLGITGDKDVSVVPPCGLTVSSSSFLSSPQEPGNRGDGPRLTLRLKRTRADEQPLQLGGDKGGSGSGSGVGLGHRVGVSFKDSDVSSAASLLCDALFDFAVEEFAQPLIPTHPSAMLPMLDATSNGLSPQKNMRLLLGTPSHTKSLLGLLSAPLSSSPSLPPCSAALRDVCCVLMSVLLFRCCCLLQQWLSRETRRELRAAMTDRLLGRIRLWLRFFAPLGVYRYAPVADVLLPECLRGMEEEEERRGATAVGPRTALAELCGVVRAALC